MRSGFKWMACCLFVVLLLSTTGIAFRPSDTFEPVAVIELFSSQGCSSCPPADHLLSETIAKATKGNRAIFALSFHVDYWNRLGWKDPFSDRKFSERQEVYSRKMSLHTNYTPQMIVNGTIEFVGSDEKALDKVLHASLETKSVAAFKTLRLSFNEKGAPVVHYSLSGDYSACNINIALVAVSEKTFIKSGENSGLALTNAHVVRQFNSKEASEEGDIEFAPSPLPAKKNMAVIAYIQNKTSLKITGAAQIDP